MLSKVDENKWIRCGHCGHKLGRITVGDTSDTGLRIGIEIKCHSCKTINQWFNNSLETARTASNIGE